MQIDEPAARGRLFSNYIEDDKQKLFQQFQLQNSSPDKGLELRLRTSKGHYVAVSLRINCVELDGFQVQVILAEDIRPRKELERQRSIQHDLAQLLVEPLGLEEASMLVLNAGIEICAYQGGAVYVEEASESQWLCKASKGLDDNLLQRLSFARHMEKIVKTGGRWLVFGSCEQRFSLPTPPMFRDEGIESALLIPVVYQSKTVAMLFFFSPQKKALSRDIDRSLETIAGQFASLLGRLRSEELLRSSELFSRSLLRSMPSGLLVRDANGKIIQVNLAAEQLLGLPRLELIGRYTLPSSVALYDESGQRVDETFLPTRRILDEGEVLRNLEMRILRPDGSSVWVSINGDPLTSEEGEGSRGIAVITFRDITEHRRMLEEVDRSRRTAETASESKSQFLANISHEIRTPLSGIMGMTDILFSGELQVEQRENLLLMKEAEESLLDIINKVLEISKIESGKVFLEFKPFRLRGMLNKAVLPVTTDCQKKGLKLDIHIDDSLPDYLVGDSARLIQVLTNFLSNSLKFTERGGITISVHPCAPMVEGKASLEFSVEDSGIGINMEQQRVIFEDFTQLNSSLSGKQRGTGLGLSISKKLVELMGGRILLESIPGQGSRFSFCIELPLAQGGELMESWEPTKERGSRTLKVLLAEDNVLNQRSIGHFLKEAGHLFSVVDNGKKVLELLEREVFDLILMDVQMPIMDGIEATQRIRSDTRTLFDPNIPIIALTAYALKDDEIRFIAAGMDRFVTKPVNKELLFQAIGEVSGIYTESKQDTVAVIDDSRPKGEDLYEFLKDYQNDLDIAAQILDLFIQDYPKKRDRLRAVVQTGEKEDAVAILHSMANNLSALRVFQLGKECSLAEAIVKEGDIKDLASRLDRLLPKLESIYQSAVSRRQFIEEM